MFASERVLSITQLSKSFGAKNVLRDITFGLNRGQRAALVGENGAGKTTLARLILGELAPDGGQITFSQGAQIGYLPQEVESETDQTISDYLAAAAGGLHQLENEMQRLEDRLAQKLSAEELAASLAEYGELQSQFEALGGYELEERSENVLSGLGIAYLDGTRQISSLSGGERTRLALAALLLKAPDLLILDEPTNHLDFSALLWLEDYLSRYHNALLMISHDRQFINRTADQIIELHPQRDGVRVYHGDYNAYLAERERRQAEALAAFEARRAEIKELKSYIKQQTHNVGKGRPPRDGDKFLAHFKRETNERLGSKKIAAARQQLEELAENPVSHPEREWMQSLNFDPLPLPSAVPLRFSGLQKSFDAVPLWAMQGLNGELRNGERVVLVAPNGSGKSSLFKLIMGELRPDAGEIVRTDGAQLGYLSQDNENLPPDLHPLTLYAHAAQISRAEAITALHRVGLFATDLLEDKRVRDLSQGQQRKLALALLIVSRANVLLLDEPTNHLDLPALEALESALVNFKGAILAISHDRWFIERVATQIWRIEAGCLTAEPVRLAL